MWNKVKLGNYIFQDKETINKYDGNDLPVLGVTNVEGICVTGKKVSDDLSNYIVVNSNRFVFNPYRINVGSIGLTTENQKGLCSPAYVVFGTDEKLNSIFLNYFFKSSRGINLINFLGNRGSVRQALRFQDLCNFEIPLPPISEQLVIVEKLENATAKLKQIKQLRAESLKETEMLKSGFIDNILNEESLFIKTDKLKNVVNENNKTAFATDFPEMIYLSLEDIEANTGKILRKRKIQETEIRGNSVKFYENCVLYSKLRPYLNKVIVTNFEGLGTTELVVLEPNNEILNTYFFAEYLRSPKVVNYLNADASGTKMPRTNMKIFRELTIPIPPLEIQNQIVNEIENFNKKLETIKHLQQQTEAEITAMEKSILNKYIQTN